MAITGDPLQTDGNFSASVDLQEPLTSPLSEPIETASDVMNTLGVLDSTPPIPSPERFDQLDTAIAALGGEITTTTVPDQLTGPTEVSNPPLLQSAIGQDAFLTHQPLALQQRVVLEDRPFSLELQSLVPEAQNLKQIQILNQEDGQPVDWLSYEWRLPDATLAEKVVIEGRFQDPSGDGVQLDVLVTDTRHDGLGLIGLELDLLWKSDAMELEQINLTPSLPLFRDTGNLDAAAGSLSGLVAASLPSSGNGEILGDSWRESFAQLNYRLLTNGEEGPDLTIIPRNYPARGNATLSAEQVVVVDSQSRPIPVLFGLAQQAQVGEHRLLLQAIDNSGRAWEQTLLLNVLNVNDSPKAIAIDPIEILEDEAFTINLADAFQDDDVSVGDSLTYQLSRGAPEWMVLDERSGLLSGQASNSEVGHWQIGVEAQDQSGATTQQTVKLVVINTNDAPLWNGQPLPEIWVRQDRPFEIRLPEQSISDVDAGDQLSYSLDLQNAEQLASLLTIDAESGTISGLIPAGETQLLNIRLVATDLAGESTAVPLRLKVVDRDFNRSPYRIGPELEQIILQEGDRFQLDFGVLFQDDDILIGDQLRFEVEAPDWLEVDPQRNRLSGSTDNDSVGEHRIRLQAIDQAGALAEKRFLLQVENSNQAPFYLDGAFDERRILINSDVWLEARDLFGDLDQIHSDKLSFGLQKNRESNLVFDPDTGELRFSPGERDQGLHRLTLTATDRSGAISLYQLNLDVITADQKGGTKQSRGEDNLLSIEPRLYLSGSGERIRTEQLGTLPAGTQLSMRVELTDQRQSSLNPGVIGLDLDLHWTGLQLRQPADRPLDESITAVFPLFRQVDPSRLNENRLRFSAASLPELGLGEALGDQPAETFLVLDFELTDPSAPIRLDLMLNEESAGGLGLAMADGSDAARQLEIKSLSAQTLIDRLIREGQEKANRVRGVGIRIGVETSPSQSPSLRGESASALQLDPSGPSGPETRTA
ncbi:MAG: putative Ig domain-containing protein, partial [Vulcanococcus sp.]